MNETLNDQAVSIREGEELDLEKIDNWLNQQVEGLQGQLTIKQFPGGASNLTYLLKYDNREMVLRRPPFGKKAKSAHDMKREYSVMNTLKEYYPCVPGMIGLCEDQEIMGSDFYVMERINGIILRKDWPAELEFSQAQVRQLCLKVLDKLIELHKLNPVETGLDSLGRGEGYIDRQISGWSQRYINARTEDVPDYKQVMQWLDEHKPAEVRQCVIHNDFRFDNVILNPDNPMAVIGVLDWEMTTIGDPLMDLGNSLAYWVQADDDKAYHNLRLQPTHLPGMLTRSEVVDYYCQQMGFNVSNFLFYEIYGLFRLAVIAQQIYYRFFHGQTRDNRFQSFGQVVNYFEKRCLRLIGQAGH
ncbi:MAG: phosphotransferase family protein [SAR324 cluster bacterium]|nr:phosphotransferase family protein [SAR324 cluster bacterium]